MRTRPLREFWPGGASTDSIAEHLLLTDPAGDVWVVHPLREGARDALSRGAPSIAAQRLRRALAEPPPADGRLALLIELASAELHAGEMPSAIEHCRDAISQQPDPAERVRIMIVMAGAQVVSGRSLDALAELDRAVEILAPTAPEIAGMLAVAAIAAARIDADAAPLVADRVAALCATNERSEVPDLWARLLVVAAQAWGGQPTAGRVGELARQAAESWLGPELDGEFDIPGPPVQALFGPLVQVLILCEQYQLAHSILARIEPVARERGWLTELLSALSFAAWAAYRKGALAEAEVNARTGITLSSESGERYFARLSYAVLVSVLVDRGEIEEAHAALTVFDDDPLASSGLHEPWLLHARGRLRCAEGDWSAGLADLLACGSHLERLQAPCPALVPWRSDAARAHFVLGETASATSLSREEVELARAFDAPGAVGIALRGAGVVSGGDDGLTLLEEAVAVLESSDARLDLARALVDLGAALRRSGRRAEAREKLKAGREIAHACGGNVLEEL